MHLTILKEGVQYMTSSFLFEFVSLQATIRPDILSLLKADQTFPVQIISYIYEKTSSHHSRMRSDFVPLYTGG